MSRAIVCMLVVAGIDSAAGFILSTRRLKRWKRERGTSGIRSSVPVIRAYAQQRVCNSAVLIMLGCGLLATNPTADRWFWRMALIVWGATYLLRTRLSFCAAGREQRHLRVLRHGWYLGLFALGGLAAVLV